MAWSNSRFWCLKPGRARIFDISTFSILDPMADYPSIKIHFLNILVPVVAHHGLSDAPEPLSKVFNVVVLTYIAVAKS